MGRIAFAACVIDRPEGQPDRLFSALIEKGEAT
jgi:hypothetical protein